MKAPFGAGVAGLGAALALVQLVLRELDSACLANLGANPAKVCGEARAADHERRSELAGLGVVSVDPDPQDDNKTERPPARAVGVAPIELDLDQVVVEEVNHRIDVTCAMRLLLWALRRAIRRH